jgi:hypothetical protein
MIYTTFHYYLEDKPLRLHRPVEVVPQIDSKVYFPEENLLGLVTYVEHVLATDQFLNKPTYHVNVVLKLLDPLMALEHHGLP